MVQGLARASVAVGMAALCICSATGCRGNPDAPSTFRVSGLVHEAAPTQATVVAGARIEVLGGLLNGKVLFTDADGRFELPPVGAANFLSVRKPGYEDLRFPVKELSPGSTIDVALLPERRDVVLTVSGTNDCVDLPLDPRGTKGRVYARFPVHHDGSIHIPSAGLAVPFSIGVGGYVGRISEAGTAEYYTWLFVNTELPVKGGSVYFISFHGDFDMCSTWAMMARHPS